MRKAEPRRGRGRRTPVAIVSGAGALFALAAAGCDPPASPVSPQGLQSGVPFAVAGTTLRDGVLPQATDLVVRFTAPVDPQSCGSRSVTIASRHRRRLAGTRARIRGDELRIPAAALRFIPDDEPSLLRIEGGATPCALRSESGEVLASTFAIEFRPAVERRPDLTGPVVTGSRPADAARDAATSTSIELRFSEPVSRAAAEDAIQVSANGASVAARFRLSADRRRAILRPVHPLPPGAVVAVSVHPSLADDAGNLLAAASPSRVEFRTRESRRSEIEEDFSFGDFADPAGTNCQWADAEAPGLLVARRGATPLRCLSEEPTADLGDRDELRFQILVRGDELTGGLASALRLRFAATSGGAAVRSVRIDAGPAGDDVLDASFQANRDRARLATVADQEHLPAMGLDEYLGGYVEVPFEHPLAVQAGTPILLDVSLALEPGARLAASGDVAHRALVRDASAVALVPAACLMVSGGCPVARSLWYDAGLDAPRWRAAIVEPGGGAAEPSAVVEFQCAPADERGQPDTASASEWDADLSLLPSWRFVRFRVRFAGAGWDGPQPSLARIVLPYDAP